MKESLMWLMVTATIYHADPKQTDSTPFITASNKQIDSIDQYKHRWIAVSRDLEPLGFTMGTKVLITNADTLDGVWTIQDRMNKRFTKCIDFLVNKDLKYGKWYNVKLQIKK